MLSYCILQNSQSVVRMGNDFFGSLSGVLVRLLNISKLFSADVLFESRRRFG